MPLSDFLRQSKRLTGTKVVCAEGDCGSCTVLRATPKPQGALNYQAINSCIAPLYTLDGASLVTVEGLAHPEGPSPIQASFAQNHGAQCGFCTPGFVTSLTAMFEKTQNATPKTIKNHLTGNLCRCTGYLDIIEAAQKVETEKIIPLRQRYNHPDMLKNLAEIRGQDAELKWDNLTFYAPTSLKSALNCKHNHNPRVIAGATDLGVQINKTQTKLQKVMSLALVDELQHIQNHTDHISIGSTVNLHEAEEALEQDIPELSRIIRVFASPQIKNTATLIGNIVNASPIGDTIPALLALGASLEIQSLNNQRTENLADFYTGYRQTTLKPDEIVIGVKIPKPQKAKFRTYKVCKRKDLDISGVCGGFYVMHDKDTITSARLAYGGVAATPVRLKKVEQQLVGKPFNQQTFDDAAQLVKQCISPLSDHRGSSDYRMTLSQNLLKKFFQECQ